jgi:hypothetical protein
MPAVPPHGVAILVLALATALSACRSTTRSWAKAPVRVDPAPVTIHVKKVRVHRDRSNEPYLLDARIDLTAERTIVLGPFSLTFVVDARDRADAEGEVVLSAGQTKHFVIKDAVLASEHELPAFEVNVTEGSQDWRLFVPLWDSADDPTAPPPTIGPAPPSRDTTFGVIAADIVGMVPERNGFENLLSLGVGASNEFGRVRVRFDIEGALAACDPGICPKEGEGRKFAWGTGGRAGIEMLPVPFSSAPPGNQFRFGAELRYPIYLLNQPRAGGSEGLWLHGPFIVPKISLIERREGRGGRGRTMGIGVPMGLLWSSGSDARPSFAIGFSMLADF